MMRPGTLRYASKTALLFALAGSLGFSDEMPTTPCRIVETPATDKKKKEKHLDKPGCSVEAIGSDGKPSHLICRLWDGSIKNFQAVTEKKQ